MKHGALLAKRERWIEGRLRPEDVSLADGHGEWEEGSPSEMLEIVSGSLSAGEPEGDGDYTVWPRIRKKGVRSPGGE